MDRQVFYDHAGNSKAAVLQHPSRQSSTQSRSSPNPQSSSYPLEPKLGMIGPTSSFIPDSLGGGPNTYGSSSAYFSQPFDINNPATHGQFDISDQAYRTQANAVLYDARGAPGNYQGTYNQYDTSSQMPLNDYQPQAMNRTVSYEGWSESKPVVDSTPYMPYQHASPTAIATGDQASPEGHPIDLRYPSVPAQSFASLHQYSQPDGRIQYSSNHPGHVQMNYQPNAPGFHSSSPPRPTGLSHKAESYPPLNSQVAPHGVTNGSPPRKIINNSRTARTSLGQPTHAEATSAPISQASSVATSNGPVRTHMTGSSVHSSQSYQLPLPPAQNSSPAQKATRKTPANQRKRPRHTNSDSLSVPKPVNGFQSQQSVSYEDYSTDSEDDSDDEPSIGGGSTGGSGKAVRISEPSKGKGGKNARNVDPTKRLPGACRNCKRLKMKCVFANDEDRVCKRCRDTGRECNVDGRKRRQPSNKREQLMLLLHEKDKLIDALLRQVYNPSNQRPLVIPGQSASVPTTPGLHPPPNAATSTTQDIHNWLANTSGSGRPATFRSPYKTARSIASAGDDTSDDEDALAQSAMVNREREDSVPISDWSGMESTSQRGGNRDESLDVFDNTSSSGHVNAHSRRLSGDMKLIALPDPTAPQGLLAALGLESMTLEERQAERDKDRRRSGSSVGSARNQVTGSGDGEHIKQEGASEVDNKDNDAEDGVASKGYFNPGLSANLERRREAIEQEPPAILTSGLVTLEDVDELFKIFFERLNVFVSILDPVLHSPATVYGRCPFLYTVVCAIASRYYMKKPHLYRVAMHFAKVSASTSLTDGWKSIEICQAYLLMSVYQLPARRWEEDRSWLYLRLAIGMATDLNLHQPVKVTKFLSETHEREILNRERTWINLFNLDRSGATQFGKAPSIKEDSIIRRSKGWYKKSPFNHPYDVHMVYYTALLKLVASFMEEVYSDPDSASGLNKNLDFTSVTAKYDQQLSEFSQEAALIFRTEGDIQDPAVRYRNELLPFLVNYSRLVMFSFGFQQTYQQGMLQPNNMFLNGCVDAATNVVKTVAETLAPTGYLRFAADGHFVFAAFASGFLLRVLQPQIACLLEQDQLHRIRSLINRLIKVLASPEVAVDERHTPKLYSRFLEGLVQKRNQEAAGQDNSRPVNGADIRGTTSTAIPNRSPHPPLPPRIITQDRSNLQGLPDSHPLSPTIEVQAPDDDLNGLMSQPQPTILFNPMQPRVDLLGSDNMVDDGIYAYSTTASSTVDGAARDVEMDYNDVLVQGDENWMAPMGAVDNPAFWSTWLMPGFSWPSPEMPWPAPIAPDASLGVGGDTGAMHPQQPYSNMNNMADVLGGRG